MSGFDNANPVVYSVSSTRTTPVTLDLDDTFDDAVTSEEIYMHIRDINDPEHPLTLEQLHVVDLSLVSVDDANSSIVIQFTPTIPHCSMATLIGMYSVQYDYHILTLHSFFRL